MEVKVILRLLIAAFTVLHLAPQTAVACSMQAAEAWENTPSRVRKNFDAAEFVVVATVVDVTMLKKAAAAFPHPTLLEVSRGHTHTYSSKCKSTLRKAGRIAAPILL